MADRLAAEVLAAETAAWRVVAGRPERVMDVPWASGAAVAATPRDLAAHWRGLRPGQLVVTGAPGAGKSVLALRLALLLLQDRADGDPVPVRLDLTGFEPGRCQFQAWLAGRLVRAYRLRRAEAEALVAARRILPVLDGLDEMDADPEPGPESRAVAALAAMDAYRADPRGDRLVLTCRTAAFTHLETRGAWAEDTARIELRTPDAPAVRAFLAGPPGAYARWSRVLDHLAAAPAGPLAQALSTPWLLAPAATAYEHLDPDGLLDPALNTPEALREHLLSLLIPATGRRVHRPARVRSWLTTLARYLEDNTATARTVDRRRLPATDLVPHELWPLAGDRRARRTSTSLALAATLFVAVVAGAASGYPEVTLAVAVVGRAPSEPWSRMWPPPMRLDPRHLGTPPERRSLRAALLAGVIGGLVTGSAAWVEHGLPVAPLGFVAGALLGLAGGLVLLLLGPGDAGTARRGAFFRQERTVALAFGSVFGAAAGLLPGLSFGAATGLAVGLGIALVSALWTCPLNARYLGLLIRTRRRSGRWLPWRLGRFLDRCVDAGLMRRAGTAYRFRHREFQDYLGRAAAAPRPLSPDPTARHPR
ncbi:NACHT domain-containing protein [Streptomyces sp. DSM 44917]|uniref:NACHT domain-containing protein n=1 Tax=Streptomyces boetiae TaxID=3075541 RepID=A0ABU2L2Y8_9ACTN|nr:NACHT domain-containing protein [Streptomyces sp. DSM 44917]MDT0305924.1 NACHT domain-containing protein [Streptomyces sp. DSM 44917]